MLIEILKPDFEFEDDRGSLKQLVHDGWKQFNVITSKSDSIRGGHYHKLNKEAFYIVSGRVKVILSANMDSEEHMFKAGDMFAINKNILHSFEFFEETLLVSMYDLGVELVDGMKDIYTQ